MSPPIAKGVVLHIFARKTLSEDQWHLLIKETTRISTNILRTGTYSSKSMDSTSLPTSRVVAISLTTQLSVSAEECHQFRLSTDIRQLEQQYTIECIAQPSELYALHKQPGLAVFDMDSTLIQQEVIDELARAVGLYDQVAAITEAAMRGEAPYTDFEASLRARVALLKGVPLSIWDELRSSVITLSPGVVETARVLKALGWKTAVLSGGFSPLADWIKETLGFDYAHANHLVADQRAGVLTGELVPGAPIVHGQRKRELLVQIAAENDIPIERTVAVGDGSNDLPMMGVAGLGVALNAKPNVQAAAPARLNGDSMLDLFYILGYTCDEVKEKLR